MIPLTAVQKLRPAFMHIGFFSSIIPDDNPSSGFEIANTAIVKALRDLGHTVTTVGVQLPRQNLEGQSDARALAVANLENADANGLQKLRWIFDAVTADLPISAAKIRSLPVTRIAELKSLAENFDAIILNSYQMAAAFPQLTGGPFGYIAHNVEHRTAQANADNAANPVSRMLYRRDARLLQSLESALTSKAKYVWALTADDLRDLKVQKDRGDTLQLCLPDTQIGKVRQEAKFDLGLIGTWTWQANLVGLQWFLEKVVPKLPAQTSIAVSGSVPKNMKENHPDITFPGRVPDATEFLQSVRAVPLVSRSGTGVQLKTIEAFQNGLACVATSSSLRGTSDLPANCRQADDDQEFADALQEILTMSRNGRLPAVDGGAFRDRQYASMLGSLKKGLSIISCR